MSILSRSEDAYDQQTNHFAILQNLSYLRNILAQAPTLIEDTTHFHKPIEDIEQDFEIIRESTSAALAAIDRILDRVY